jgi:hypothetical protein
MRHPASRRLTQHKTATYIRARAHLTDHIDGTPTVMSAATGVAAAHPTAPAPAVPGPTPTGPAGPRTPAPGTTAARRSDSTTASTPTVSTGCTPMHQDGPPVSAKTSGRAVAYPRTSSAWRRTPTAVRRTEHPLKDHPAVARSASSSVAVNMGRRAPDLGQDVPVHTGVDDLRPAIRASWPLSGDRDWISTGPFRSCPGVGEPELAPGG